MIVLDRTTSKFWYTFRLTEIYSRQDVTRRSSGNKSCWTFARDNEMYARFQVRGGIQEIRDEGGVLLSDAVCYDSPAVAQFTDNLEYLARNFVTVLLGVRIANSGNLYDGISLFGELIRPVELLLDSEGTTLRYLPAGTIHSALHR
jgi:hypothetical protein